MSLHADLCINEMIYEVIVDDWLHLLSHDLLPEMYPEIWRGFWPSVSTEICSCPRDNQKSSRLFRSASTSAKSESCRHASENMCSSSYSVSFIFISISKCVCFNSRLQRCLLVFLSADAVGTAVSLGPAPLQRLKQNEKKKIFLSNYLFLKDL